MEDNSTISRRDFIRTTAFGAAGLAGAMMLPACDKDTPWYTIPRGPMNLLGAMQYMDTVTAYNSQYGISSNSTQRNWVLRSRDRIKPVVEAEAGDATKGFAWEVDLYNSSEVNAWCMPGARMAFYSGIMRMCEDEPGVAIVMGHEVAHAVRNHAGQRLGMQLGLNVGLQAVNAVINMAADEKLDPVIIETAMQVFAIGGQFGMLAYSRSHEHEADRLGLMYAAKAGYNPTAAPRFWNKMVGEFGDNPAPFLSTHPSSRDRSRRLDNLQQEALEHYENSEKVAVKDRIKNLNEHMDEAWEHYKQAIS